MEYFCSFYNCSYRIHHLCRHLHLFYAHNKPSFFKIPPTYSSKMAMVSDQVVFHNSFILAYFIKLIMMLKSVFENKEKIPGKYTCDGDNVNPELIISEVPENAESLVLIMDDPDIPNEVKKSRNIDVFVHWVLFNIHPSTTIIEE